MIEYTKARVGIRDANARLDSLKWFIQDTDHTRQSFESSKCIIAGIDCLYNQPKVINKMNSHILMWVHYWHVHMHLSNQSIHQWAHSGM